MSTVHVVSDLQNNLREISRIVHDDGRPVLLTGDAGGDMVILSRNQYEALTYDGYVAEALAEAEAEERTNPKHYTVPEVREYFKDYASRGLNFDH